MQKLASHSFYLQIAVMHILLLFILIMYTAYKFITQPQSISVRWY